MSDSSSTSPDQDLGELTVSWLAWRFSTAFCCRSEVVGSEARSLRPARPEGVRPSFEKRAVCARAGRGAGSFREEKKDELTQRLPGENGGTVEEGQEVHESRAKRKRRAKEPASERQTNFLRENERKAVR